LHDAARRVSVERIIASIIQERLALGPYNFFAKRYRFTGITFKNIYCITLYRRYF
jgi:hypothetical protein